MLVVFDLKQNLKLMFGLNQHLTPAGPGVMVTPGEVGRGGPFLHARAPAREVTRG